MDGIDRHKPLTLILPRYTGIQSRMGTETVQEVNKAERYTLVLDLTPEEKEEPPLVLELASDQPRSTIPRSQGVHYLLLLAIPMPMIERLGEYTDREERDRKHKVASEASGESNERVRIGPITLTQGESIAWFPTGRKGLGLDVNCKMKRKL
ncbi:hypothetical protein VNO77_46823 [Canavalia gladiata]|uniref:Uncharacterized protein n=1 Tax=Canavalia gladiata TaxID=3824 RepID=A0AAN9JFU2_CANGL